MIVELVGQGMALEEAEDLVQAAGAEKPDPEEQAGD